jgi:hypothetical protein
VRTNEQYVLDAFRKVQAFLDDNAGQIGAIKDSEGKKLLDATIAQFEEHGMNQSTSRLEIDGHASLKQALEAELKKEHLLPIASFARARLRGLPDYATLTRSTWNLKGPALVRAARAVAEAAQSYAGQLVKGGFPEDTLAQLNAVAGKLEATIDGRSKLKVRRVSSTTGIGEMTKQGREAVGILSAVIERQFAKDKTFLAAWKSAKRVVAKPGFPRGSAAASVAPAAAPTAEAGA